MKHGGGLRVRWMEPKIDRTTLKENLFQSSMGLKKNGVEVHHPKNPNAAGLSQNDGARFGARLTLEMLHNIRPTYPDTEIFHTLDFCLGCDSIPEFVRKPVDSVTHREMS